MHMSFWSGMESGFGAKAIRTGVLALMATGFAASHVAAAPVRVQGRQDQRVESSFALDFGAQGGVASAMISRTDFELEIDGVAGTAQFNSYDQDIDALTLPGPLSTGAIRVQVVPGSSTGTFDRGTGAFVTNELYSIEFDGDLSAYGLVSPVILPSQSVGVVDLENSSAGRVTMNWAGSNLNNPLIPLDFSYICTLFATFSTNASSYVELQMIPMVLNINMPETLRDALMEYLNSAISAFAVPNVRSGVGSLRTFIFKVRNFSGNVAQADANALVAAANTAIAMAENRMDQVMLQNPDHVLYQPLALPEETSVKNVTRTIK